ncbi:helix-turn-helix domain-containing protein [Longispora sp. NPDC051575]|uniref:helix-turn-helix domain-containing protein n=1 Tax=Longispora sp. NPDC051575 TaxID=3154943 RepID=UPI0034427A50
MEQEPSRRIVQDVDTLKALADPIRLTVLELMMADHTRSWTAKELASRVGISTTKIYYHLNTLEQRALLQIRSTRIVNGIIEKHYGASQQRITFQRGPDHPRDPEGAVEDVMMALFDQVRGDINERLLTGHNVMSREAPPETRAMISHSIAHVSPARAEEFRARLLALAEEFRAAEEPSEPEYQVLIAIHPRN